MSSGRERDPTRDVAGFSLLELLVALALAGIVAAIALPSWNRWLQVYHLDSSARQVRSEIHNIKMRSVAENIGFQLNYLEQSNAYTVQRDWAALFTKELAPGVVVLKAGTIAFSPRGTAAPNRIRLRSADGSCRQVVVSVTGKVRVCQPSRCDVDC